jgi:multiple sugar transport system permease protein
MVILRAGLVGRAVGLSRPNGRDSGEAAGLDPADLTLDNFARKMFGFGAGQVGIRSGSYFTNSLIISLTSTAIALLIGMAGGYAFARFRFRGKGGDVPRPDAEPHRAGHRAVAAGVHHLELDRLIDTQLGLILVYVALNVPFTIWLIDGFFRQIPMSTCGEAAQIDGCTRWQAFWKVEFPLARSGIAAAGIFAFLTSWNEYALASQLTRSTDSKTLPVGLLDFTAQFTIDWAACAPWR